MRRSPPPHSRGAASRWARTRATAASTSPSSRRTRSASSCACSTRPAPRELQRYELHGPHDGVFNGFLPGVAVGPVYGLRAHGPYDPCNGHRFNAHKLLLDPCAREIVGRFEWRPEHHGYQLGHPDGAQSFDDRDNAAIALKARVAPAGTPARGWLNAPRIAPADVVLYEVHVKGFSQQLPGVPADAARHLRRPGASGVGRALQGAGRHHAVAAAGALPPRRAGAGRPRADQLLGLQHARLLLPRPAPGDDAGRSVGRQRRVPRDGRDAARARPRGGAGRRLQPYPGG